MYRTKQTEKKGAKEKAGEAHVYTHVDRCTRREMHMKIEAHEDKGTWR